MVAGIETEQLKDLIDQLKRAVIREYTLRITYNSGQRELKQLRESRNGVGKPTAFESATAKGMWGFEEYLRAATKEADALLLELINIVATNSVLEYKEQIKQRKARTNGTVVVPTEPHQVDVRVKRKVNRKL